MDIAKELEKALKDLRSAQVCVANELGKGGDLPHAYAQLQRVEQVLKKTVATLKS